MNLLRKCAAEFIGAFAIVFAGCGAVAIDQISGGAVSHVGVAATFGLVIMVMIYATRPHFWGAFQPGGDSCVRLDAAFPPKGRLRPYILAQCAGAVVASCVHVASLSSVLAATQPGQVLNLGVTLPVDGSFTTAASVGIHADLFADAGHYEHGDRFSRCGGRRPVWAIGGTVGPRGHVRWAVVRGLDESSPQLGPGPSSRRMDDFCCIYHWSSARRCGRRTGSTNSFAAKRLPIRK